MAISLDYIWGSPLPHPSLPSFRLYFQALSYTLSYFILNTDIIPIIQKIKLDPFNAEDENEEL